MQEDDKFALTCGFTCWNIRAAYRMQSTKDLQHNRYALTKMDCRAGEQVVFKTGVDSRMQLYSEYGHKPD